jgi:signal transduction histidine kinase
MTERRLQFVAAVTHELRTPLTSFQLYSDLLADMPREDAVRRHQYAEKLQSESKRLSRLVENVLAYSRIGDSRPKLDRRSVGIRETLEAVDAITRGKCETGRKKLALDDRCGAKATIETDSEFVVQILANLIENACKYSAGANNPSIWLCAYRTDDGGFCFEVEDAGPGVDTGDRRTIFEPFHRSDSAESTGAGGVGLGLALSRHWAECLGGTLTVKRGSRSGSALNCFVLCLPKSPLI